jgi:hypothetical protein
VSSGPSAALSVPVREQSGPMVGATRRSPTRRTACHYPPFATTAVVRVRPSLPYLPMPWPCRDLAFALARTNPFPHGALAFKTRAPFSSGEHRAPPPPL